MKRLKAHVWVKEANGHYVEPDWVSRRLFQTELFLGPVWDPACGFGRIPDSARAEGLSAYGTDIVDRGYDRLLTTFDFLKYNGAPANIVCNPPFDLFEDFVKHSLRIATGKVAMISLVRRLPAARWLRDTPLVRVWMLTPRPSMPPGHTITAGEKPGGGTQDFCWLCFSRGYTGEPTIGWLHRDGDTTKVAGPLR